MASNSIPTSEKTTKCELPNLLAIFPVIAPTFSPQQFFSKPTSNVALSPVEVLHNFHKTIASTADKCLQSLHFSATQNPFLNKLLSFSSYIHNFSQVHCRSHKSLNSLSSHNFAAVLPGDSVAGIVVTNGILNFLNIYNTLLVVRLVLTWFPSAPPQIVSPLSTLCDPYLNIFRGIIPPLGGTLDLSPILAFLLLNAFTSAAAALPAELPPAMVSHEGSQSLKPGLSDLTSSQKKWQTRLQSKRSTAPEV
ncbi:ylmG homolog protein 2, chloroplastic [Beta vulgaris subsp. vulgaris]|uniref:ylmG homolog protein 2, chloroplastic n=1 Tax=Beta vulgaris subsp. vulgaris TaxID=3555 RepID=UPI002036F149|nr:ylmG homolog protein 2, chloroplastic [Beta vulgaris subsp. vulgaris]